MDVLLTATAKATLLALAVGSGADLTRARKVAKTLRLVATNPRHPGLHTHRYEAMDAIVGVSVWQSYVENRTPTAWRLWWYYGPGPGQITVIEIGPHP